MLAMLENGFAPVNLAAESSALELMSQTLTNSARSECCFKAAKWFDNVIVDAIGVDGTGVAVNLFNLVLRIVQSGKIQFYFVMLVMVLASYIWTLNI